MKLQTNELKKFLGITSSMKQNGILPILSYIRFQDGIITKNNLEQFVEMEANFKGECLIDERVLTSFVNSISGNEIDVEISKTNVLLTCGKDKTKSPTTDISEFPISQFEDVEEIELTEDVINKISIASNFAIERENAPYTSCVFIGDGIIGASNSFIAFVDKIDKNFQKIILEKNAANVIKSFNYGFLSQSAERVFFKFGDFKFGFIKKDTKFIDFSPFSKVPEIEKVVIDKNEIVSFCDSCIAATPSKVVVAAFDENRLIMNDNEFGVSREKEISVEVEHFAFNPSLMNKLLKALPDEEVSLQKDGNKFYITGKGEYVSIIMEIFYNNKQ